MSNQSQLSPEETSAKEKESLLKKMVVATIPLIIGPLVPIILGSFFITGAVESYKSTISINSAAVKEHYQPLSKLRRKYFDVSQRKMNLVGKIYGNFQVCTQEFKKILSDEPGSIQFRSVIFGNIKKYQDELDKLKAEDAMLSPQIHSAFEECSIVSGTFIKFKEINQKMTKEINEVQKKHNEWAKEWNKGINPEDFKVYLMKFEANSFDLNTDEKNEFLSMMEKTIELWKKNYEKEIALFDLKFQKYYPELKDLIATAINNNIHLGIF